MSINEAVVKKERDKEYKFTSMDRLRFKTKYFTDSGIICTKGFVSHYYEKFKGCFNTNNEKNQKRYRTWMEFIHLNTDFHSDN